MTNYTDGLWHGWNGGDCPVHPESRVEWMRRVKFPSTDAHAGECQAKVANWHELHAFRVIKEHKDPREWYISPAHGFIHEYPRGLATCQYIHVREVLE